MCIDRPVFFLLERFDFAFAFHNQAQGYGLHPSSGKTTANFIPKQRRNLIANQPVKHAPRLLRIYQVLINGAGMFERRLHRTFSNFIEGNALNAGNGVGGFFFLLLTFFRMAVAVQLKGQMRRNGLAFAVRVRRQIDRVHRTGQLLQLGQNFFFPGDYDVVGLEVVACVHTERALGQILHVAERGLDSKSLSQIFLDGLRLGRRFDND